MRLRNAARNEQYSIPLICLSIFVDPTLNDQLKLCLVTALIIFSLGSINAAPAKNNNCEMNNYFLTFNAEATRACETDVQTCINERQKSHPTESFESVQNFCWGRPLSDEPNFLGPCPRVIELSESKDYANNDSLLQRVRLRYDFRSIDSDEPNTTYKQEESLISLRRIVNETPDNLLALELLTWLLLETDEVIELLNITLKLQELEPYCPNTVWLNIRTIRRLMNEVSTHWLEGEGSGSELSEIEVSELYLKTRRVLIMTYDVAIEKSTDRRKIHWALESIYDWLLSEQRDPVRLLASQIGVDTVDYREKRRASVIKSLMEEFSSGLYFENNGAPYIVCSSYALALGLHAQCLQLLTLQSQELEVQTELPEDGWFFAALSLVIGLTRDCSDHHYFQLGAAPLWWHQEQCLSKFSAQYIPKVLQLRKQFEENRSQPDRDVLDAYLVLDESSDERFLRALERDGSLVLYASRLVKRLHKIGRVNTALNILNSISEDSKIQLSRTESHLLDEVANRLRVGDYVNVPELSHEF